jgi:hypothetical protein
MPGKVRLRAPASNLEPPMIDEMMSVRGVLVKCADAELLCRGAAC